MTEKKDIKNIENEDILDAGLNKTCNVCVKVLGLFIAIYAAAAGNVSLVTLPYGGLYLLGGLTVKLENYIIKENHFRVKMN
jgi:glucokinase